MQVGKSPEARGCFPKFGVVFHGAGTEWIKAGINAKVLPRQARKMAHHLGFAQCWQIIQISAQKVGGKFVSWQKRALVGRGQRGAGTLAARQVKEERFVEELR